MKLTRVCEGDTRTRRSPDTAQVTGTVYAPQTFVAVRWGYVSLLAAQLSLVLVFFVATVAQTYASRMQILKGSAFATMCALDGDTRAALGSIDELGALGRRAGALKVRLQRGGAGDGVASGLTRDSGQLKG